MIRLSVLVLVVFIFCGCSMFSVFDGLESDELASYGVLSSEDLTISSEGSEGQEESSSSVPVSTVLPYERLISGESMLMCIGDSLTELGHGYAQIIEDTLKEKGYDKVRVIRKAHSGYRVGDIYPLVDGWLDEYPDCKLFTILLGTNDTKTLENWFAPCKTKYYYFNMIKKIKERVPDADIRILQIPYILKETTDETFLPSNEWEKNKDVVNQIIRSLARRYGMPYPPDLYEFTYEKKLYYVEDGLHFSFEGYKALAPVFIDLLKAKADYKVDANYLHNKPYTVKGGMISKDYPDDGKKLTRGKFSTEFGNQIGFRAADNGGNGATINVDVEFSFGKSVLINDLVFITGTEGYNYAPDSITIYKKVGGKYIQEGKLTTASENSADAMQMSYFNMYTPKEPFRAEGIKITYTKTYKMKEIYACDWLLIGDVSASVLLDD